MFDKLLYYITGQARNVPTYIIEQLVLGLVGWVPSIIGIGLRAIVYRLIMRVNGVPAIETNVRLAYASNITLGNGVYLDQGVYLHALPGGISIDDETFIMHHTMLHVFNFRNLPNAKISIGKNCFIGEYNVMRGQGGISMGNDVYTGPFVQLVAVNHVFSDPNQPIRTQGITAQGIVIEDDVWLGSGVTVVDGVTIGKGSVIGAGAVVTNDIPPYSIAIGTPAKPIRDRRNLPKNQREDAGVFFGALEDIKGGVS